MKKGFLRLSLCVLTIIIIAGCGGTRVTNPPSSPATSAPAASAGDGREMLGNMYLTGLPIVNQTVTLTMAAPRRTEFAEFDTMSFFKKMEEETGVHIEWETFDRDNGWVERRGLMMASQSYPDCIYFAGFSDAELMEYGEDGIFIALND